MRFMNMLKKTHQSCPIKQQTNMITINKYKEQRVEHFDNNGNSLGFLNEFENLDLRCQIAEQNVSGYYLMFNDKKFDIQPTGRINGWEHGLFDTNEILLARLFRAQRCYKSQEK